MAYVSQEMKAKLSPAIKAALKKYSLKGSISVRNHSTLVLKIKSGSIDFLGNYNKVIDQHNQVAVKNMRKAESYIDVNPYWYQEHFDEEALQCLKELFAAMNDGNWDRSDIQTDYFDVGWYVDVNIGDWDTPYHFQG